MIEIKDAIIKGLRPSIPGDVPTAFAQLIESCWSNNPIQRPKPYVIVKEIDKMSQTMNLQIDKEYFDLQIQKSELPELKECLFSIKPRFSLQCPINPVSSINFTEETNSFVSFAFSSENELWVGLSSGNIQVYHFDVRFS